MLKEVAILELHLALNSKSTKEGRIRKTTKRKVEGDGGKWNVDR